VKKAALSAATFVCLVTSAFACWQAGWPRVTLATRSVNLRVTYNDKAQSGNDKVQSGRTFQLHKAITLYPTQTPPEPYYEKKVLKSAITDSQGLASFGEVAPGIYWITGGAGPVALTVILPTKGDTKRIWVSEFADGCISAVAEMAD